ncbi:hypothetical protein [Mycobacteroides salmoniphilum]|uniref:Lipoprotein n=1 Tax=Mycobacteroides salmoniphilum TaxID=404941 RepID=A0A4R8SVE6_9MYCO|nr:hypothetical protein [Mycobacteroides salmoniphilum]TEA06287.1 hypothetical protein CCUG60884_01425 [Mycobacteroides salmoniphilum]
MRRTRAVNVAACLLAVALTSSGCQTVRQAYGYVRGTNPSCMRVAEYTAEVHDRRSFVGGADNVFVGKVQASEGQHVERKDLYSLFTVHVVTNLKGQLSGDVTVSQIGGNFNGTECLQNNDEILSIGKTYLFTTIYSKNIDKHFVAASNYGDVELSPDDVATLHSGTEPPIVSEFRDAVANQIPSKK